MTTIQSLGRLSISSFDRIAAVLHPYLDAARSGSTVRLRAAFDDDARITGWIDGQLLNLNPDAFVGWVAENGASPNIRQRIVSIDVSGLAAAVRIEFQNWLGFRFTDFLLLAHDAVGWRITSKVYHAHGRTEVPGSLHRLPSESEDFGEAIAIGGLLDDYVVSARDGDRAKLHGIWFDHARIVGRLDSAEVRQDPEIFAAQVAETGGAPKVVAQIVSIDRSGVAASARIELNNWNGVRYTDFFTLLKGPTGWRISGKVFDAHSRS